MVAAVAAVLFAGLLVAGEADASHLRYGTLSYEQTENENEVEFIGAQAWRATWFVSDPADMQIGDIFDLGTIRTGDGGSVTWRGEVVSVNVDKDWFFAVLVDGDGDPGVRHTYQEANDPDDPYVAFWEVFCRIDERWSGNYHVNNPCQTMRTETLVDISGDDSSPVTNLPPINQCPIDSVCEIHIPAFDPDGDDITFRHATGAEAGSPEYNPPGAPDAPHDAHVDEDTGTITWNTTGAEYDPDFGNWSTLYSMQTMLESRETKAPVDFFIELVPEDTEFPYWTEDTTICDTTQELRFGETITFDVTAASDDEGREIHLDHLGLPPGATFPLPTPDNPVTGTFEWAPGLNDAGTYLVIFTAVDDQGAQAIPCPVTLEVTMPAAHSLVTGLWAGTNAPASLEYRTERVEQRGPGEMTERHATVEDEDVGVYAEAVNETANVTLASTTSRTQGTVTIESVELLDGLVTLEGLTHTAHLEWDIDTNELVSQGATFSLERLTIDGEEVQVEWEDEPVQIPLPNGGVLELFNQTFEHQDHRVDYAGHIAHAYAPLDYARSETIVGSLVLAAGQTLPSFHYESQPRTILEHDDARSDQDAGNAPEEAEPIEPGVYDGSLPPGDSTDYYAINLTHGEKINLALQPAPRFTATGGSLHADKAPPPNVEEPTLYGSPLEFWSMRLIDPDLEERDISDVPVSGSTERIEFNADTNGTWFVEVNRETGDPPEAYNYTLSAAITPVPFLPDNDATPWGDLPPACDPADEAIPRIDTGVWPGQFKHADYADTYRFNASIGEIVTVALKPGETLDGVNMALVLYDEDCQELQRSSWYTGTDPVLPKGLPEATPELPSQYTGEYFIGVERVNGVGNYYLSLTVANPQPTLPQNDAFTGNNTQPTCEDATPAPPLAYQGRLDDEDPGDAYNVTFQEGYDAYLAVEMSALSQVHVELTAPSGDPIQPEMNLLAGTWVFDFDAPETGDYCLQILPEHGGGNYMVAHGEHPPTPPFLPDPTQTATAMPLTPAAQATPWDPTPNAKRT